VNVVVTAVASPTKAQAFLDAEGQFPPSMFYCSQDLQAYKTLGFHGKFGAEQEGGGKTVFAGFVDGMKSRFLVRGPRAPVPPCPHVPLPRACRAVTGARGAARRQEVERGHEGLWEARAVWRGV
jgi:hypothetical protein